MAQIDRSARRFGYTIAAIANGVMIWVVHNVLAWNIFGWITNDFSELLPWLTVSFVAGVMLNLIYVWDDAVPIKSPGQILSSVIGFVVTTQTLTIFPFDFTGYDFDFSIAIRIVLWISMIGIVIGVIAEATKLAKHSKTSSGS
ncbi:MAG: hypothetical protein HKN91_02695 [Acidimicrobiia bacterium]|nr:hypothetical protein [Acidimicrobiia bacterium]